MKPLVVILSILFPLSAFATTAPWRNISPFVVKYISNLAVEYEVDPNLALAITWCESRMRMGAIGTLAKVGKDYGGMQISEFYHRKTMEKMGLDIERSEDSLAYGMWLLKTQGEKPWRASKKCRDRIWI